MLSWGTHRGCSGKKFQPQPVLSSLPIADSRDKPARLSPLTRFSSSSELEKFFFPLPGTKHLPASSRLFPQSDPSSSNKALKTAQRVKRASCQQLADTERCSRRIRLSSAGKPRHGETPPDPAQPPGKARGRPAPPRQRTWAVCGVRRAGEGRGVRRWGRRSLAPHGLSRGAADPPPLRDFIRAGHALPRHRQWQRGRAPIRPSLPHRSRLSRR